MPLKYPPCSLEQALEIVAGRLAGLRGGERRPVLYLPGNAGRIDAVEQWIFTQPQRLAGVDVFQVLALGPAAGWERAVLGGVGIVTPFIGPGVRELVNAGLARNIRCNLSQVPRLFEDRWRPDVAFAHTSPPDAEGRVTLGLNAGIDVAPLRQAAFKVAIVNARVPRWHIEALEDPPTGLHVETGCAMLLTDFDLVVEIDAPLVEHRMEPSTPAQAADTAAIAEHVVAQLAKAASAATPKALPQVIQLGIGKIPDAVASALVAQGLSVRGVWSELFSDGVLALYRAGLVRQTKAPRGPHGARLRDRIVVGFVIGSTALYEAMRENPDFAVMPQSLVNDPAVIRHNDGMVSINSALAVSLGGEVAAATIRKRYYSDVGGQFDFALGASWARDGMAIIALPSAATLRDGALDKAPRAGRARPAPRGGSSKVAEPHLLESRIVALHAEGAHHTIGADLPVVVVTEQGAADLRGLNDTERVEAMLGVAHPRWREVLAKEARLLPSMQGVAAFPPKLIGLHDGRTAVLRPAGRGDIDAIGQYIEHMSSDDRHTRYMGTIAVRTLTSPERLTRLYDRTLDYSDHAAFIVELEGEIIGVAHAFRIGNSGTYEISFSRRSDLVGQGIGRHLMRVLIEWGVQAGASEFYATTYRTKNPRMRALFDRFGFAVSPNPDEPDAVIYTASVDDLARAQLPEAVD